MLRRIICFQDIRWLLAVLLSAILVNADPITDVIPPSVLFEVLALNKDLPTIKKPKYNSPCAMVAAPDGMLLYIAQQTAKRIDVYDTEAKIVARSIHLPDEVTGLAVSPDSKELYATCSSERWPAGKTCVVNLLTYRVTATIATGWGSCAPVLHPDGSPLYVCNRFGNDVSVIDLVTQKEIKRIPVSREPCCAAITPDGATLVVGNGLSEDRSTDTTSLASLVSLIDVTNGVVSKNIRLLPGSKALQGMALSADGKYAFITHLIGHFNLTIATVAAGWSTTNNLTVIDLKRQEFVNSVSLDLNTIGMANPWGVRCSDDGKMIIVAHAGCDELSVIQYAPFIDTVLACTDAGIDLKMNYHIMIKSRKRIEVKVNNPRSVAIIGNKVFTAGYFSDSLMQLEIPDITDESSWAAEYITLGTPQPQTAERKGEQLFYDANLCFQKWESCHTCHPNGRADGFNWKLGGGAMIIPKNTRGLLYSWWTPPTTWTGRRGPAGNAIRAGIELELFQAPKDEFTLPLDTFCMNMRPVQSPYRVKGRLSAAAIRGKTLFFNDEVKCFTCHSGALFTDLHNYTSPVTDPWDAGTKIYTPFLIEAWRSKPYGHFGSITTVHEMIETYMKSYTARELMATEIDDLTEYVLSL